MTASPLAVSRLPVGSSARISLARRDQRARYRDALLLAAGKLLREMAGAMRQPDPLQCRLDAPLAFSRTDASMERKRSFDALLQ